jgi:probable addiction module antidote protein
MARVSEKKKRNVSASLPYDDFLDKRLKDDPLLAVEYLNTAMEDEDSRMFLIALSNVARAYGIGRVAEDTKLDRTNLYRMLSKGGNPRLSSLEAILDAIGMRLRIEMKDNAA